MMFVFIKCFCVQNVPSKVAAVTKKLSFFVLLDRSVEMDVMTRHCEAEQG